MPRDLREIIIAVAPTAALPPSFPKLTTKDTMVIALLVAWYVLRKLQWILGPWRRRSGSWLVQYGAMAAYYLPTPIIFYTASTVYSSTSPYKVLFSYFCSAFLMFSSMYSPTVMTAYTLSDSALQRWRLLPWLLYFLWLQFDFFGKNQQQLTMPDVIFFCIIYVAPVLAVLLSKSPVAMLDYQTNAVADYMARKARAGSLFLHDAPADDNNTNSLQKGCQYPFTVKDESWVTIKDLWQFDDQQPIQNNQDTFLSYSFCWLLARRYFKFGCFEEGNAEVRSLALTELLSDYKRAFALVEVQLAFLHDHFFTDYPTKIGNRGSQLLIIGGVTCGVIVSVTMLLSNTAFGPNYLKPGPVPLAVGPLLVCLLEVLPRYYPFLLPRYWHPVREIFKCYPAATGRSNCQSSKGSLLGHKYYWRNKMGQYSLLADYDHRSLKKACINWFEQRLLSHALPDFIKHHSTAEDDVSVPDSIRSLVARTLQQYITGPPTKGTTSLRRNTHLLVPGDDLLWTCELEYHTETILVWHIATCYCNMVEEVEACVIDDHEVATALSKYCAYLLAFLPEFLPDHRQTSVILLQTALQSAKDILGRATWRLSMEKKGLKIQSLELPEHLTNMDTFEKGIYLGRQLMLVGDAVARWKVMAEFWAETIIYIAPSDDAVAHVERLAKGGEFVTHLWAMLSNAGILKRATEETTPQQQGVQPTSVAAKEVQRLRHGSLSLPAQFKY